jgi:hypothetical protein
MLKLEQFKLFLLFPAWFRLGSFKWAYRLAEENFTHKDIEGLDVANGDLVVAHTGVKLTDDIYTSLKGGLKYWSAFARYKGVEYFGKKDGHLMATVDGIQFRIDHDGSLFILDEIFAERLYDLRVNEDLVAVDVGMNVGVASLFFASLPNVKQFTDTAAAETLEQAKTNFSLNPNLRSKNHPGTFRNKQLPGKISVPATFGLRRIFY